MRLQIPLRTVWSGKMLARMASVGFSPKKGHIIGPEPRKLKGNEKSYAMRDLELAAIVHALKM